MEQGVGVPNAYVVQGSTTAKSGFFFFFAFTGCKLQIINAWKNISSYADKYPFYEKPENKHVLSVCICV